MIWTRISYAASLHLQEKYLNNQPALRYDQTRDNQCPQYPDSYSYNNHHLVLYRANQTNHGRQTVTREPTATSILGWPFT